MPDIEYGNLPFDEAIKFFQDKGTVTDERDVEEAKDIIDKLMDGESVISLSRGIGKYKIGLWFRIDLSGCV